MSERDGWEGEEGVDEQEGGEKGGGERDRRWGGEWVEDGERATEGAVR